MSLLRSFTGQPGTALSRGGNTAPGLAPGTAVRAQRCHFPVSSWVHAFILTCDDKLAVWFKRGAHHADRAARGGAPGVCCLYPQSNGQLFELAVAWWSAGHFVHRFLYRILAYQIVQPPAVPCGSDCGIGTACCPGVSLPTRLQATVTGGGACNGSYALSWVAPGPNWKYSGPLGTCSPGLAGDTLLLTCGSLGGGWQLTTAGGPTMYAATSATCSPFALTFTGVDLTNCGGTGGATVTVTT
jgi:hypothetical protein